MAVKINYNNVEERDMDTLFLEAFASDKGFLELFTNKIEELNNKKIEVLSIELSKTDNDGESDITVIIENENRKIGLLIEDKINAIAMPDQCERYSIRGKKGIKNGDYDFFYVFIVSPAKYYENNDEAKKYEYHVLYEECLSYFEKTNNIMSEIWIQQFSQAIEKAKKTSSSTFNPVRNEFLKKYIEYQKNNFCDGIDISSNPETAIAGGWINFRVSTSNSVLYHKAEKGQMDLTFFGCADNEILFKFLAGKIKGMGYENVYAVKTGKSMAFRIDVPTINFDMDFANCNKNDLDTCFIAAQKLTDLADLINYFSKICQR